MTAPGRRRHRALAVVGTAMVAAAALAVVLVVRAVATPAPWDPLYGPVEAQRIVEADAGGTTVEAQKCNAEPFPVLVEGPHRSRPAALLSVSGGAALVSVLTSIATDLPEAD